MSDATRFQAGIRDVHAEVARGGVPSLALAALHDLLASLGAEALCAGRP